MTATSIFCVFQESDAILEETGLMVLRTTKEWPDTIILPWNDEEEHTDFKDAGYNWYCEDCHYINYEEQIADDERIHADVEDATDWGTSENQAGAWDTTASWNM